MISIEELDKTILDLESHDTTFAVCEKLAWLYIVRDHVKGKVTPAVHEEIKTKDQSEFLTAVNGKDINEVLNILNEHFDVVKILMPKEYDNVIMQIYSLKMNND